MFYIFSFSNSFLLQVVILTGHGCHTVYELDSWWHSLSKLGHFSGLCINMMKICSASCTGCLKRDLADLSQNNEMDSRSIWVEFPAGADICTFFYAEDGKSMNYLFPRPCFGPPSLLLGIEGTWGRRGQGVMLPTRLHFMQRFRMSGALHPLLTHSFSSRGVNSAQR
jgi:hypothetical protein